MNKYICYVDGGCNNKTHNKAYGSFAIFGNDSVLKSRTFLLTSKTSNEAEYDSLITLLEYINSLNYNGTAKWEILSDSRLVVNQMNGRWSVTANNLVPLYKKAKVLYNDLNHVRIRWVKREKIVKVLGH